MSEHNSLVWLIFFYMTIIKRYPISSIQEQICHVWFLVGNQMQAAPEAEGEELIIKNKHL